MNSLVCRCGLSVLSVLIVLSLGAVSWAEENEQAPLRLARFDLDVTPPVGTHMAYDLVRRHDELTLRCRGVVILGSDQPIVLCAIDWIGVANASHDAFRETLADAAGATRERVAVHALHQHDAPGSDFTAEQLIRQNGLPELGRFEGSFQRRVIQQAAHALRRSLASATPLTHWGWGVADVKQIASNRRILGPDGKVRATRYTATRDPELRAEPEGVIDPELSLLTFYHEDRVLAALSYYACHPQSYYRTGIPSSDFPGIARFIRGQAEPATLHVHFNGAGGNIGAGKYNDGAKANRMRLALRMAEAMEAAWKATERKPLRGEDISWTTTAVALPPAKHLDEKMLIEQMKAEQGAGRAVYPLSYLTRYQEGKKIDIACLAIGDARILHLPGELFVEYQLEAKAMRPGKPTAMAAYGDYGTGYIGTAVAYEEGGYETSARASYVAPESEELLMQAMRQLLRPSHSDEP